MTNKNEINSFKAHGLLYATILLFGIILYQSANSGRLILEPCVALFYAGLSILQIIVYAFLNPYLIGTFLLGYFLLSSDTRNKIGKDLSAAWNNYFNYFFSVLVVLLCYQRGYLGYISNSLSSSEIYRPWSGLTLGYVSKATPVLFWFVLFNILCLLALRHISKFESKLTTKAKYVMGMIPFVLVIVAEYIIYNFIDEQYLFLPVYIRAIEAFSFVIAIAIISKTYTTQFEKNSFFQGLVILGILIGSFVGGIQTLASLRRLYGPDGSVEIIGNMNNKVLLRTGDPESAKFMSELIGKEEVIEPQEQITIGPHEVKGSTTFTKSRGERTLVTESEMMDLKKLNGYLILADKCPVIRIKYDIVKNIDSLVPKFIKDALSHDKYAQDLINKHEPEFKATEFYQQYCSTGSEGQLVIHDNTVSANEDKLIIENDVKDSSDFIMSDLFSQGDNPVVTDGEVLGERKASTFEVLDDGVVLTLDDNSELRVKQKNLGIDDIKKSNLKLANGGTVLMVDGQINNIDELICSNDINYATISSVKVVGDDLLLGLSNNDLFSVDIDTLELPKSAEKKPKTSSCKKVLIWGKKEMSLEETIKIGRLIDG